MGFDTFNMALMRNENGLIKMRLQELESILPKLRTSLPIPKPKLYVTKKPNCRIRFPSIKSVLLLFGSLLIVGVIWFLENQRPKYSKCRVFTWRKSQIRYCYTQ